MPELPQRKRLHHAIPLWVESGSLFFVTICTQPRKLNQLCRDEIGEKVIESAIFYHEQQIWWLRLFLLMPDHVHALLAVPADRSLPVVLRRWKAYQTRVFSVNWQPGFFDHRLRSVESLEEKADYIRMNPVRAGLVAKAEDWAFVWPKKPRAGVADG